MTTEPATIHQRVLALLKPVLGNSWYRELPPRPTWPAIVFQVATEPEDQWCMGGGYDAHDVSVAVMARTAAELDALLPTGTGGSLRPALASDPHFQFEQSCEDADYEADAQVYARVLDVRFRTPRY